MNKKIYSLVYIGRFDNLPFIYFRPKKLVTLKKKNSIFCFEINGKWLIIQVDKKNYCPTSSTFFAIFEGPGRKKKLMPHFQISLKSW